MVRRSKSRAPGRTRAAVGDQVRFTTSPTVWTGRIVEDRGPLGVGAHRLYGIRFPLDASHEGEEESRYIELPTDEFEVVTRETSPQSLMEPAPGRCYPRAMARRTRVSRDEAARDLIAWHFRVEPDLVRVYRIISENESSPDEPIKLLEVNRGTVPTGKLETFVFAPTKDFPYRTAIAEITPEEFDTFARQPEGFPRGWDLDAAQCHDRPKAA